MTHDQMVAKLTKPEQQIVDEFTLGKAEAIHHAIGIAGEAGELLDAIKKYFIYNKEPDVENIIEELGDLEFYMAGLRQRFGITRDQTIQANMEKLAKRYGENYDYTDKKAHDRADKQSL